MCLMSCLYFIVVKFITILSALHLAGSANGIADALSHNQFVKFFTNHPQASSHPYHIPAPLLDLLIHTKPDWTSPSWNRMFTSILNLPFQITQFTPTVPATGDTYLNSCSQFGINPYPTSEVILCQFAGFLGRQHLKHKTIRCYLSGIRYFQIMQSYHDPFIHNLRRLHYMFSKVSNPRKQRKSAHPISGSQ